MASGRSVSGGKGSGRGRTIARARIDWDAIEVRYVTGTETLRELAAELGITQRAIEKQSSARDWNRKRSDHRKRVASEAQERITDRQIREESELNADAHEFHVAAMRKFRELLDCIGDARDARDLTQAHRLSFETARLAARLPAIPLPDLGNADDDGVIRIRRRSPDGEVVEVTIGDGDSEDADGRGRPDRLSPDADAVEVSAGPDAHPGPDGRTGERQDADGR